MGEWQPIDSAPKDGSYILLVARDIYSDDDKGGPKFKPVLSWWDDGSDWPEWSAMGNRWAGVGTHWRATHWIALPALPAAPQRDMQEVGG